MCSRVLEVGRVLRDILVGLGAGRLRNDFPTLWKRLSRIKLRCVFCIVSGRVGPSCRCFCCLTSTDGFDCSLLVSRPSEKLSLSRLEDEVKHLCTRLSTLCHQVCLPKVQVNHIRWWRVQVQPIETFNSAQPIYLLLYMYTNSAKPFDSKWLHVSEHSVHLP